MQRPRAGGCRALHLPCLPPPAEAQAVAVALLLYASFAPRLCRHRPPCRRDARLAAREHLRTSLQQVALQGTELRLRPITHAEGGPTLPPALRVDPAELALGRKRSVRPALTSAHVTQMVLPQVRRGPAAVWGGCHACAGGGGRGAPFRRRTEALHDEHLIAEHMPTAPTPPHLPAPQHANSIGITFGGQVMRWMEQCAFIAASRVARGGSALLTAAMDSISFLNPTRVGDTVYVVAQVGRWGGRSRRQPEVLAAGGGPAPPPLFRLAPRRPLNPVCLQPSAHLAPPPGRSPPSLAPAPRCWSACGARRLTKASCSTVGTPTPLWCRVSDELAGAEVVAAPGGRHEPACCCSDSTAAAGASIGSRALAACINGRAPLPAEPPVVCCLP